MPSLENKRLPRRRGIPMPRRGASNPARLTLTPPPARNARPPPLSHKWERGGG